MESNRRHGFGNYRMLAGIIALGIVLFSAGTAQAAPQYDVTCDFCHRMPPLDSPSGTRDAATGAEGEPPGACGHHCGLVREMPRECGSDLPTGHRNKRSRSRGTSTTPLGRDITAAPSSTRPPFRPTLLGSCSNVNCHFESATPPGGAPLSSPPATAAGATAVAPNTGNHPVAGSKHGTYYGTGTGACQKCHPDHAIEAKPFAHATSAANRGIVVRFTSSPNTGGTYSGDGLNFLPSQHKTTFGSCSNLYCHSNGAGVGPNVIPVWGASLDCKGCHNSTAASGAPMTTGKHGAHINNAVTLGANYGCAECHGKTVSNDDTTIADVTRHVKGFVDFSGAKAGRSYSSSSESALSSTVTATARAITRT